jgi:hypothetical protein
MLCCGHALIFLAECIDDMPFIKSLEEELSGGTVQFVAKLH